MDHHRIPDVVSHDALLSAIEYRFAVNIGEPASAYFVQLRHTLLSLARKARLEVIVQDVTGLPPSEVHAKSTAELMVILDTSKTGQNAGQSSLWRYLW